MSPENSKPQLFIHVDLNDLVRDLSMTKELLSSRLKGNHFLHLEHHFINLERGINNLLSFFKP